ncbi:hypothetical protein Sdia_24200 [Streptomyces diastaticus subsp. diastaticus]|uniref:DUF222 domain-containing protein n=1 Tax=Streptomyces diastaticus subsp. diastaticus TaxID=68040 RepID=A0ABQ1CMP4_STRDI|nr:hypothetical protein [Streptomyces diastaticus]GFH71652.1 hypothetical protein Sdia_24200 [Streptomyces diastaticus subsp. diastaticus]GGU13786.1 hypothetical protein GCM10015534_15750 [Streptomyces diastaticus subsp. diastaticus]
MTTEEHARWNALEVREPGQVPAVTPLAWQVAKLTDHADRLMNNALPDTFPYEVERGTAGDALAVLALRESIRRDVEHGRGTRVHEALLLGASWREVAAALNVETGEARELLRTWAQGQRNLWQRNEAEGRRPFGLDADAYAAVLALVEWDDEAPAPAAARVEERHQDDTEPVKESTRRYAEELRANPGKASADGHTGWECSAGASLIAEAMTPGPGSLGTMHGVIYVCPGHQADAETLISTTGCIPEVRDAPPRHRWDPWPCGHVTAFGPQKGPKWLTAPLPDAS